MRDEKPDALHEPEERPAHWHTTTTVLAAMATEMEVMPVQD
jgi:hypothetical protein